jgi:hypothetical protein
MEGEGSLTLAIYTFADATGIKRKVSIIEPMADQLHVISRWEGIMREIHCDCERDLEPAFELLLCHQPVKISLI